MGTCRLVDLDDRRSTVFNYGLFGVFVMSSHVGGSGD
jgi:hypothetical protein